MWYAECLKNCYNVVDRNCYDAIKSGYEFRMTEQKKKTVALATLGCKVNQFESAAFRSGFESHGFTVVEFGKQAADLYVINTCAVTAKAGAESRRLVRRALRLNPEARLVVTGCYAQVASADVLSLATSPIRLVGNGNKDRLVSLALAEHGSDLAMSMGRVGSKKKICDLSVRGFGERTRAFLRVQDGCNNFCSYCVVPYARGRSRSLAPDKVLAQAGSFAADDYKEQVVTGIHVGHYGHDLDPSTSLLALMRRLVGELPAIRFRISSLEPTEVSIDLLQFMADTANIMPHLHIPLQSGDDTILRRMKRRYSVAAFATIVEQCRAKLPQAAIGVDVLVGFPGEDAQAFEHTYELLAGLPVTYLHVFPYSRRPGTAAAAWNNQVAAADKNERVARLRQLDQNKRRAFYQAHLNEIHAVLAESAGGAGDGYLSGFTENYIPVTFVADPEIANQVVRVRLQTVDGTNVRGRLQDRGGEPGVSEAPSAGPMPPENERGDVTP